MRQFDYTRWVDKQWDADIIDYIAKIHEYKGKQSLFLEQQPHGLDRLVDLAIVQSTMSSNKIEGIVTTNQRMKELVMKKVTPETRDEEEIMGYQDVLRTIHEHYEYIPITSSYILQAHKDLYHYSRKTYGGHYKNTQNYISETHQDGSIVVRFVPLSPFETPMAVERLCDDYHRAIQADALNPLLLIPIFIHDFLCIHPFNDGNGRLSRLLTTLLLYQNGYVVGKYISLEEKIEHTKRTYYDVLEQSGVGWHENKEDPTPFIKYILGIILSAYKNFEERIELFSENLSAVEQVRKAVTLKIGRFTKSDVMALCPGISRASIENSLTALVKEGYIDRHGKGRGTYYVLCGDGAMK